MVRDAEEAVYRLLPSGICVVCLDFEVRGGAKGRAALLTRWFSMAGLRPAPWQGSGLSEGEYVTLGAREVDDVQVAKRRCTCVCFPSVASLVVAKERCCWRAGARWLLERTRLCACRA